MIRRPLPVLTLMLSLAFGAPFASAAAAVAAAATDSAADNAPAARRDLRETYTKYEYRIPMRDGTRLFTVVYVPKDS